MTKFIATLLLIIAPSFAPAQDNSAKQLADALRDFNEAFGDVVEGELTPAQIDEYERMITPLFDVVEKHDFLCRLLAVRSTAMAATLFYFEARSTVPQFAEMAAEMREEIVTGSLTE